MGQCGGGWVHQDKDLGKAKSHPSSVQNLMISENGTVADLLESIVEPQAHTAHMEK
jgi:hypothetical protein